MTLRISADQRHFEKNGQPFFWLGDTAWLLFAKLSFEEAKIYLQNRKAKGFTVIQATLIHFPGYATVDGKRALQDDCFDAPVREEAGFWAHALSVVRYAGQLGLVMALLPAWGSFVKNGSLNEGNAEGYIQFLTDVFGGEENVIWLVGGDVRADVAPEVFSRIGGTLRKNCPRTLIGYHPFGRCSSSFWLNDAPWLDFHMFQSGHRDYTQKFLGQWDDNDVFYGEDNYRYVINDRALTPVRPTLDGEPGYELIPHGLHDPSQPYWQAADARRYAYWSLLHGAAGHTYGDNAIMQFHRDGDKGSYGVLETWREALHDAGSGQMQNMRRLMETIHFQTGVPANGYLIHYDRKGHAYQCALLTDRALCAYIYEGESLSVRTDRLPFHTLSAAWFDPVSGALSVMEAPSRSNAAVFRLPDRRCGQNDWILLLTDAALISLNDI